MYCGFSEGSAGGRGASREVQSGSVTVYVKVPDSSDEVITNELVVIDVDTGEEIATIPVSSYKIEYDDTEECYYHYLRGSVPVSGNISVEFPW